MARRFVRGHVGGSKRHGEWSSSTPLTALTVLAGSTALLTQIFVPQDAGETIIRTRGLFGWSSDQTSAGEDQMGAVGIGVVSEQAATVGITAVPHPDTDAAWGGWLWHSYYASRLSAASAVGFEPGMFHRITIDSKAMRKLGESERMIVVVENSNPGGIVLYDSIRIFTKAF